MGIVEVLWVLWRYYGYCGGIMGISISWRGNLGIWGGSGGFDWMVGFKGID